MNKKLLVLFLLVLVSACAVSHVSAVDESSLIAQDNSTEIEMQSIEELQDNHDEVLESVNEDYRNIQHEIDIAEEGSTIYLNGNYTCDYLINVNKSITIEGNDAVIKYNGSNEYTTPFFNIEENASNVVLKNIKFIGSVFYWGGAITWKGDNGTVSNCEFIGNTAVGDYGIGGAILILGQNCSIYDSIFTDNHAKRDGGAILSKGAGLKITNCVFNDNVVTGEDDNVATGEDDYGGALVLYADNCTISKCTFNNNHCTCHGGAIASLEVKNITIRECEFNGNYVSNDNNLTLCSGGAIFSISQDLIIDNCTFKYNYAYDGQGGAVNTYTNNTILNSYFIGNMASSNGGNDIYAVSINVIKNHFVIDYNETLEEAISGIPTAYLIKVLNNTFEKIKVASNVTFTPGMIFEYGDVGSIFVKVVGGTLLLENITVLNHTEAKINYTDNILTVSGLDVGNYTLIVTISPDENHTSVVGKLNFTVKKALAVISSSKTQISVALKSSSSWSVKLIDPRNGKPISGIKLTLKVYTGSKYKTVTVTTNPNGVASYKTYSLAAGTHKIIASGTHSGYDFNTLTSYVKVVKQTPLKFKLVKRQSGTKGSLLSYYVLNKNTGKAINGVKLKVLIYTGKKYKTYTLTSKKVKNGKKVYSGAVGFSTNDFSAGKHVVKITPTDIKYKGSLSSYIVIQKSATKGPKYFRKL